MLLYKLRFVSFILDEHDGDDDGGDDGGDDVDDDDDGGVDDDDESFSSFENVLLLNFCGQI